MGQRPFGNSRAELQKTVWQWSLTNSELGWFGFVFNDKAAAFLTFGHSKADLATQSVNAWMNRTGNALASGKPGKDRSGWTDLLCAYFSGEPVLFDEIPIHRPGLTEFSTDVLERTRAIAYGSVLTYGELANEVAAPRAARAVGRVMSQNCLPIIVPCHRVVGSGGALTGFSAPRGVNLKQELLDMESRHSLPASIVAEARKWKRATAGKHVVAAR